MIKKITPTDEEVLSGIRAADRMLIEHLYDRYLPGIIRLVKRNNGSESEARDIFQEVVIVLFRKANDGEFRLTSSLQTYILVVCRNLWRKKLRNHREVELLEDEENDFVILSEVGSTTSPPETGSDVSVVDSDFCEETGETDSGSD